MKTLVVDGVEFVKKSECVRKDGVWSVGERYFIRTVTMALSGRVVEVTPQEIVLAEASWIADTGRFASFLAGAEPSEIEPFPQDREVIVGRNSVIDAVRDDRVWAKQK
jgi:hypothetical protein